MPRDFRKCLIPSIPYDTYTYLSCLVLFCFVWFWIFFHDIFIFWSSPSEQPKLWHLLQERVWKQPNLLQRKWYGNYITIFLDKCLKSIFKRLIFYSSPNLFTRHQRFNEWSQKLYLKKYLKTTNYFIDHQIQWNFKQNVTQNQQNIFCFPITKFLYSVTKIIYLITISMFLLKTDNIKK